MMLCCRTSLPPIEHPPSLPFPGAAASQSVTGLSERPGDSIHQGTITDHALRHLGDGGTSSPDGAPKLGQGQIVRGQGTPHHLILDLLMPKPAAIKTQARVMPGRLCHTATRILLSLGTPSMVLDHHTTGDPVAPHPELLWSGLLMPRPEATEGTAMAGTVTGSTSALAISHRATAGCLLSRSMRVTVGKVEVVVKEKVPRPGQTGQVEMAGTQQEADTQEWRLEAGHMGGIMLLAASASRERVKPQLTAAAAAAARAAVGLIHHAGGAAAAAAAAAAAQAAAAQAVAAAALMMVGCSIQESCPPLPM